MLLELIPPSPTLPTFSLFVDFADCSHGHQKPLAWSAQMAVLLQHNLDLPRSLHMFDKAVGLTSLLELVRFDFRNTRNGAKDGPGLTNVRCEFVDGAVVEWAIPLSLSNPNLNEDGLSSFFHTFQSILKDVHTVRLEEERAKLALQYEQQQKRNQGFSRNSASVGPSLARRFTVSVMRHSTSMPSMSSGIPSAKSHKRQKSFLQTIVTAVGSIVSPRDAHQATNTSLVGSSTAAPFIPASATPPLLPATRKVNGDSFAKIVPQSSLPDSVRPHLLHQNSQISSEQQLQEELFLSSSSIHQARAINHRKRVQAGLVDAFRRFVLAALTAGGSSSSNVFLALSSPPEDNTKPESSPIFPFSEEPAAVQDDVVAAEGGDEEESASPVSNDVPTPRAYRRRPLTPTVSFSSTQRTGPRSRANSNATLSTCLSSRDPYGPGKRETHSYCTWVLKSMLRRTEEEMEGILRECEEQRKRDIKWEMMEQGEREVERQRLDGQLDKRNPSKPIFRNPNSSTLSLKISPSKLLKKRSTATLKVSTAAFDATTDGSAPGLPTSKFRLSNFMLGGKRKSKQTQGKKKDSWGSPPLSPPSPSFPVHSVPLPTTPPLSPRRLVHFALAADSDQIFGTQDPNDRDSGRFSPTTMEVPSSFSDDSDDEDEAGVANPEGSGIAVDIDAMPFSDSAPFSPTSISTSSAYSGAHSRTTSTSSSGSSSTSDTETEMNGTAETAATSPSSSPPLTLDSCEESELDCDTHALQQAEAKILVSTGAADEAGGDGGQVIQYGYAVTCDEAVSIEESVKLVQTPIPGGDQTVGGDYDERNLENGSTQSDVRDLPMEQPSIATRPFVLPPSYNHLLDLTHKLRSLLIQETLAVQGAKDEEQRQSEVLEVRGRRRAWSNGVFMRGVSANGEGRRAVNMEQIMGHARERVDAKRREWERRIRRERNEIKKRKLRRRGVNTSDDESGEGSCGEANNERALPPLPLIALSVPFNSSPLALSMYTAQEKEEQGLVYMCPVKEETVFYLFSNPPFSFGSGSVNDGTMISRSSGRLSMDGLDRSVVSAREKRVRRTHGLDEFPEDVGFGDYPGGLVTVDEIGYMLEADEDDIVRFNDMECGVKGFSLGLGEVYGSEHAADDDGIEWQSSVDDNAQSYHSYRERGAPPTSPPRSHSMLPPRPHSVPTRFHPPPTRLFTVSEESDSDDEGSESPDFKDDGDSPTAHIGLSGLAGLMPPNSGGSELTSCSSNPGSDDDDEFEFDRMRLLRNDLLVDEEEEDLQTEDDEHDKFFADISHITHIVNDIEDGLGRRVEAQGRSNRLKLAGTGSCGDLAPVYHRQRMRVVKGGVSPSDEGSGFGSGGEREPASLATTDGGNGSKNVSDQPLYLVKDEPNPNKAQNHRKHRKTVSMEPHRELAWRTPRTRFRSRHACLFMRMTRGNIRERKVVVTVQNLIPIPNHTHTYSLTLIYNTAHQAFAHLPSTYPLSYPSLMGCFLDIVSNNGYTPWCFLYN